MRIGQTYKYLIYYLQHILRKRSIKASSDTGYSVEIPKSIKVTSTN